MKTEQNTIINKKQNDYFYKGFRNFEENVKRRTS